MCGITGFVATAGHGREWQADLEGACAFVVGAVDGYAAVSDELFRSG